MFGGVGKIMEILSGGPGAIKNILKTVAPEVISGLHTFFKDKFEFQDGESSFIIAFAQHKGVNVVMAIAIHDKTNAFRVAAKFTVEQAIEAIPDKDLNLGKLA